MYVSPVFVSTRHINEAINVVYAYLVSPLSNEELINRPVGFLLFNESFQPTPFHAKVPMEVSQFMMMKER